MLRFILLFALVMPSWGQDVPKTFQDFFKVMVRKNNTYVGAFLAEESAKERKEGTLGLYFPTLSSSYSFIESEGPGFESQIKAFDVAIAGNIPQLGLFYSSTLYSDTETVKPRPITHQGQYNFTLGINLLKDFGPRVGKIPFEQADFTYDLSKLNKLKTIYSMFSNLLFSYGGAYAAQKNLEINIDSEKRNQDEMRKSMEQYRAGKIPKLSLLSLQAQTQQIRSQVIGQERSLRENFRSLYTLGSIENDIQIPYHVELEPIKMPFFNEKVIDRLVSKNLNFNTLKNPDYHIARINLEQNKLFLIQAENNVWPALTLNYSVSGSKGQAARTGLFPQESKGNAVSLNFSVPLGLITERHELSASKAEYRSAELTFIQLKRQLERDWNNLVEQYDLIRKQVQIGKELVSAARQKYEAALPTSSLGPTYQQNVIIFQNEWISAQISLNQLEVEYLVTQFQVLAFHSSGHILSVIDSLK